MRFEKRSAVGRVAWSRVGTGALAGAVVMFLARDLDLPTLVSYPLDRTLLLLPLVILGALAWGSRLRGAVVVGILGLGAVWGVVALTPLCAWMADGLVRRDPLQPADAVFVHSSRLQADGDPDTSALSRLVRGLELLGEKRAPRLILSELHPPSASYAAYARAMMRRLGLALPVVTVGPVWNTRDEAVAVAALCRQEGWERVLVVTSPYHTARACASLEQEGLEVICSPSPETRFDLESLDRPGERLAAFGPLLHERVGIWVYARRGWIGAPRAPRATATPASGTT